MKKKILILLRLAVASVFIASGFLKLMEPSQNFLAAVYEYKILSGVPAGIFAVTVPWVELIAGALLFAGIWPRPSLGALWFLSTLFAVAVASAMVRKIPVADCGCFGGKASMSLSEILIFDMALWSSMALLFYCVKRAKWR